MSSPSEGLRAREFLVLWGIALAIAVPLGVLALRWVRNLDVPPSAAFHEYNAPRVDDFAARIDDGAYGIVLLGDSRMRNATPIQEHLAELIGEAADTDVAVLRLVNDWAIFDDFAELADEIVAAEPSLVVMQEELRERHRGLDATELLQREYLWWKLLGRDAWSPGDRSQDYLQLSADCAPDEGVGDRLVRVRRWLSFDPNGPTAQRQQDFVAALAAHDIEHRYLTIPVTTAAATGLPGVDSTTAPIGIGADLDIGDEHFCDVVHLGPSGRAIFTEWFVDEIAELPARSTS